MRIGDLAKEIALSIQTIRFYEKEGLIGLPERTEGRFRVFSIGQRDRLIFIKTLRELGFPLEDVRSILAVCDGTADNSGSILTKLSASIETRRHQLAKLSEVLKFTDEGGALADIVSRFVGSAGK